ncbi:hypothetical protein [Aurantibacter aestuarii]|uniref:Uncharacterized protein n=1 Tax=Aurantibacter aestuarii TaxID=1266046 RepID=A0A2T1NEK7_9FLAO|nr:hypothetical protein [Aurantibacter aestuarii]PSG90888.1 hypothetical protein C7H52_06340 [Aurantibacter aestuarii]
MSITNHTLTGIVLYFKDKPIGYKFKLYDTLGVWELISKDKAIYVIKNTHTNQIVTTTMQQQIN